jgi:uncharacterized Zn finger protein (UPF0148 family)
METELKCPNCGTPAHAAEAGKKIVCASCGGTFEYVAGEARLQDVGQLDKLQADIEELKQRLPASTPAADPPAADERDLNEDPEIEDDDDEDL